MNYDEERYRKAIASCILSYRSRRRLTQQQMFKKVGLSRPTISRLECGAQWPQLETLLTFVRGLDMSMVQFFRDVDVCYARMKSDDK